jgi:hypothetical protein
MLSEITRHSRFTAEEFSSLAAEPPLNPRALHTRIRAMLDSAETFIATLPSEAVGVLFLESGKPVQPDVTALEKYARRQGAPSGLWPSSPEISHSMLDHYKNP